MSKSIKEGALNSALLGSQDLVQRFLSLMHAVRLLRPRGTGTIPNNATMSLLEYCSLRVKVRFRLRKQSGSIENIYAPEIRLS